METPDFNHISKFPSVYEPNEDTFLLLDALESELSFIDLLKPVFIAEIGSGSGVNITSLSKALQNVACVATDINFQACLATKQTSQRSGTNLEVFNMHFLNNFRKNLFDIILFNPPYVVTQSNEIFGTGIERSWAGGYKGREVIDKLLPQIFDLLTENGVFYLVVIKENKPAEIFQIMENLKFQCSIVKERKILGEHLYVLKFQKTKIKTTCL